MKLLLVFMNNEYRPFVPPTLVSLEGYIEAHGHEVEVFDTSFHAEILNLGNLERNIEAGFVFGVDYSGVGVEIKHDSLRDKFKQAIGDFRPDLIGFGVYGTTIEKADELARSAKEEFPGIPIIYGGPEVAVAPVTILQKGWVDLICIGEGEKALLDVCNRIDAGESDFSGIHNIWFLNDGDIHRSRLGAFIDLNDLPPPDWSSYAPYHHYGPIEGNVYRLAMVEFSRGCPYSCTYCESTTVKNMYAKDGITKYNRRKSPEKFVSDCEFLVNEYDVEFFYFTDGTFLTMPTPVLEELAHLFASRVNRPFLCLTSPTSVTEDRARLLKKMGCYQANMGIEAGDQDYRKDVLGRPGVGDDAIVRAFHAMQNQGIRTSAYNMIGMPWQDRKDVFKTIELTRKCAPTRTNLSIFMPFEGTILTDRLKEEGYISADTVLGDESSCTVDVPGDMSTEEILGLYRTFQLYCKVPRELFPLLEACEADNDTSRFVISKLRQIYLEDRGPTI